jgi:hypothetical protein
MEKKKKLRVLSLGAGVQSTTVALMIEKGEIPKVDCAIFADVKAEPQEVYKHLDWLKTELSYPLYVVSWRDLKKDILDASKGKYKGFTAPFFTKNTSNNEKGMLRRQCTADYKIKPVIKKIRELLGYKKGDRVQKDTKVELLMGISIDEVQRMKTNRMKYIENQYPLIDKYISRKDCLNWIKKNNYPTPPRSACTFCPFHSNLEWHKIKTSNPKEWEEVIKLDKAIRTQERFKKKNKGSGTLKDELYLHRSCKPIDEINFLNENENQLNLFINECEGYCGI